MYCVWGLCFPVFIVCKVVYEAALYEFCEAERITRRARKDSVFAIPAGIFVTHCICGVGFRSAQSRLLSAKFQTSLSSALVGTTFLYPNVQCFKLPQANEGRFSIRMQAREGVYLNETV